MDIDLLPTLSDLALEMPPRVSALLQEGEALEERVRALLESFDRKRAQAREVFTQVEEALGGLRDHTQELKDSIAADAEEVASASRQGQDALSAGATGLDAAAQQAEGEMESLTAALAEAGAEARQAEEQAASAVRALDGRLEAGGEDLSTATETVAGETAALVAAAESLQARVQEGSAALQQKMTELLERAQGRIGALIARLGELQGTHEGALGREASHLETRRDELLDQVRERLEERITDPTAAAVDAVRGAFVAWGQDLQQSEARAQAARAAVSEGCEAVRAVSDPLPAVVEQVKAAADKVGLNFG